MERKDSARRPARLIHSTTLWLPATLLAALIQSWRTAAQQRSRASLSINGAGLVRYFYGLPLAVLLLAGWSVARGVVPPVPGPVACGLALAAGLTQILATNLLLMAFSYQNYLAGTAYAKTEAIQGALLALMILGEHLSWVSWAGIAVCVGGVLMLAGGGRRPRLGDITQPAALCGVGAGLGFALTSIWVKMGVLHMVSGLNGGMGGAHDTILAALVVLVITQAGQVAMQGGWLLARDPEEIGRVLRAWRVAAPVGVLASLGSACQFTAMSLAPVALVRTVAQVEVFFTFGFSKLYLKETVRPGDVAALFAIGAGVALALAGSF